MSGSSIGRNFIVTTFGESHGAALGVVVDGADPGVPLCEADIQKALDRRRPGQSAMTTQRRETDRAEILSGVFEGKTTGTPIAVLIRNHDQRSGDYSNIAGLFRPGHADFGFFTKYGHRDYRGGGRSSGRETVARTAAGAIAAKMLENLNIRIVAATIQIAGIRAMEFRPDFIELNPVRCPDPNTAVAMAEEIAAAAAENDSVGGIVECRISGVPAGVGEPVFEKLDAELAKAMLSLGAVKGIEFGDGFGAALLRGSRNNDQRTASGFLSNHAGGILGGMSTGQEIVFRIAVKPTASVSVPQQTVNTQGETVECRICGRHDPCICPRIVPVVESMAAIVLFDLIKSARSIVKYS